MDLSRLLKQLDRLGDIIPLAPQLVGRFYDDANRLGQRKPKASRPPFHKPERWLGSCTAAVNPPGIPPGGISICKGLRQSGSNLALKDLLIHADLGPRLLGQERFSRHKGQFRVLIKILDALHPIPLHIHADDAFVGDNPAVYPGERLGKDEAYCFLDAPRGICPYTHLGLYPGVTRDDFVAALRAGTDRLLELSPAAYQHQGEGFIVPAGLLHRPGTALTLEIQQPSDVYCMFQQDLAGQPLPPEALHPGFESLEQAAERIIHWAANQDCNILQNNRLQPTPAREATAAASVDWVFPPQASRKFSGQRLTVRQSLNFTADDPFILLIWQGLGTLDGKPVDGGAGPVGKADEFFVGLEAARRGIELHNSTVDRPLVAFALFPARID